MADYSIEVSIPNVGPQGPAGPSFIIVDELPSIIPSDQVLLYEGTLYRGLTAQESSANQGKPWPVVGYKTYRASLQWFSDEGQLRPIYVHENTLGGTVLWNVGGILGEVSAYCVLPFASVNKQGLFIENNHGVVWDSGFLAKYTIHYAPPNEIHFDIFDENDDLDASLLTYWQVFSFGFKIYPNALY
jgi:hypothetical protein